MKIHVQQGGLDRAKCDVAVLGQFKGDKRFQTIKGELDAELENMLLQALQEEGFEGKLGEWFSFPTFGKAKTKKIAVIGWGDRSRVHLDDLRKLGGYAVRRARDVKAKNVCFSFAPAALTTIPAREAAAAFAEGACLSAYRFHAYKGKMAEQLEKSEVEALTLVERDRRRVEADERGIERGERFARATMLTRDLVNTPAAEMIPRQLVEEAKKVATPGSGITLKVFDPAKMEAMGMHAALAIARGSHNAASGAHLTYKPKGKAKKKIVLVGKAVTFDSGGLSLKPAEGMMTMKIDMAGAATVIGLFSLLPYLKPDVEVHGIFLAVENMPSGNACRPGDVVKAMNGVTIEILNTDAEGRVTLADALSYAQTLKPDAIIDLATLTGACVVALGEDMAGYMTNDKKLGQKFAQAAEEAGEDLWELPLYQAYEELIRSRVADIKNIGGGRAGGAITAGLFLSHFVDRIPWVHVDIAGPSYAEKEIRPDQPAGGTGYGVRSLARYLERL